MEFAVKIIFWKESDKSEELIDPLPSWKIIEKIAIF